MKRGLKTLIAGILLFLLGAFVVPLLLILPLLLNDSAEEQFLVPGSVEVTVDEPGRYYLWHDFRTVYEGVSYSKPEEIPDGLDISVKTEGGEELVLMASGTMSSSTGASARRTIGYVDVADPGRLTVTVNGDSEPRVFSFSQSGMKSIFLRIFGGAIVSMLMAFAGIGLVIWGIVKLAKRGDRGQEAGLAPAAE